jgi:hypothetical protein
MAVLKSGADRREARRESTTDTHTYRRSSNL